MASNDCIEKTPLTENVEYFNKYYKNQYSIIWAPERVQEICDAYCVDINDEWATCRFDKGEGTEVYKQIIVKCRCLLEKAKRQKNKTWEKQLVNLLRQYQKCLLDALTKDIYKYCMDA